MNIAYFDPLMRAWERMKNILWRPFDLAKWLVLGFSVWLAALVDGAGGGEWKWVMDNDDFPGRANLHGGGDLFSSAGEALIWVPLIFVLIMAAAAILLVLLWISSRAKFIFLDNVVHNRAQIVEPWHRLREIGDSLFLWRVGFVVACGLIILFLAALFIAPTVAFSNSDVLSGLSYAAMGFGVLILAACGIVAAFVILMLEAFVIPIMYKYELKATEAWSYFMPWLKDRPLSFILYALFVLMMAFGYVIFLGLACVLTCCIVALPYVGTVILLPVWVTYRIFSLEFLTQFDPGFDLFSSLEAEIEKA